MRPAVPVVLAAATVLDAVLGTARMGAPSAPVVTLSVVAGIGLATKGRTGAFVGFGAGVVFDLLAGPASPGGVHALVGLAVGSVVGVARPRVRRPVSGGVVVGAAAAGGGTAVTLALQGLATSAASVSIGGVVLGALAGAIACPMVLRFLRGALPERAPAA